jgi:acyl dehydratase
MIRLRKFPDLRQIPSVQPAVRRIRVILLQLNHFAATTHPICGVLIVSLHHAMTDLHKLYLDDLHLGQRFTSEHYRVDASQIKKFAVEFDPQPFHLDESAAETSIFRGLAASGWHTAAIAMRLLTRSGLSLADGIVGLGCEIAWPRPTRPGDNLHLESEIVEITPSRSKPDRGIVILRSTMLNQNQ